MKRAVYLVLAVFLLASVAYAAEFKLHKTWWSGSQYEWQEVMRWHVEGVLENTSKVTYPYVEITFGIYDRRDNTRMWTETDSTTEFAPNERWKFYCQPGFCTYDGRPAKDGYYYKFLSVKVWTAKETQHAKPISEGQ